MARIRCRHGATCSRPKISRRSGPTSPKVRKNRLCRRRDWDTREVMAVQVPTKRSAGNVMRLRWLLLSVVVVVASATTAYALTSDEIKAKLEAAGYSQVREMPA